MYGSIVICTQNLAVSGANQVLLNLLNGGFYEGNVLVLSPSAGPFDRLFNEAGASVRISKNPVSVLSKIHDIRFVICNTIMTADIILQLNDLNIPHLWILHEWWPKDILSNELKKRNLGDSLNLDVVNQALLICKCVVGVCASQLTIYNIKCPSQVIFIGVPNAKGGNTLVTEDTTINSLDSTVESVVGMTHPIIFLCMGIVCPRKNQVFVVKVFKKFCQEHPNIPAKLIIVGARYVRDYEIDYVNQVKAEIGDEFKDKISLEPVTNDPASYYRKSDVLLFASVNEVTPLVIPEAMCHGLPVITTNIAGIPEMLRHNIDGYVLDPTDEKSFVNSMNKLALNRSLLKQMGINGKSYASNKYTLSQMVNSYTSIFYKQSPIVILVDMDNTIANWDGHFEKLYLSSHPEEKSIDRSKSWNMEQCVVDYQGAIDIFNSKDFFLNIPPFEGAIAALKEINNMPFFEVLLVTSPITTNVYCWSDKLQWIRNYFGPEWESKMILSADKTNVIGDILIDDKPIITGRNPRPYWSQVVYDMPYNQKLNTKKPRINNWTDGSYRQVIKDVLLKIGYNVNVLFDAEKNISSELYLPEFLLRKSESLESMEEALTELNSDNSSVISSNFDYKKSKSDVFDVDSLPDFSEKLKLLGDYRADYSNWRKGGSKGAKGEVATVYKELTKAALEQAMLDSSDFDEIHVLRKGYKFRQGYSSWRQGRAKGARIDQLPQTIQGKF